MRIDDAQILKRLIEAFFREFLELFCPAEVPLRDFSKVEFLRHEHFTDVPRGRRRRQDLVAKVGLKRGGAKLVLVHGEFEAGRKKQNFPRRMFRCFCQLLLRYDTLIVPIAMFTDEAIWRHPLPDYFEWRLSGRTSVRFEYYLIKLKQRADRQFVQTENPLAYGRMAKMNYNRAQQARLKTDFLQWILAARTDPARRSRLAEFVETYMPVAKGQRAEFQQRLQSHDRYAKVAKMITTYETDGIEKGKQQVLILQLEKKFGKLDDAVKRRILQIDTPKKLDSLLRAALDAEGLDELPWQLDLVVTSMVSVG